MILAFGSPTEDDDVDSGDENDAADDDDTTLPAYLYGLVFFRNIRIGRNYPVPRLDQQHELLTERMFRYLFNASFAEVGAEFFRTGLVQEPHSNRMHNKARRTVAYVPQDDGPHPTLFDVEQQGLHLHAPPHDGGSDVEAEEEENHLPVDDNNADALLTEVWLQFLIDITQKCSNRKSAVESSYCRLSEEDRENANEELYKNCRLSDFFNDYMLHKENGTTYSTDFGRFKTTW